MATIFRSLMTAVLLLYGYVAWTGWQIGHAIATGADGGAAGAATHAALLTGHLRIGLVASVIALLAQSLPFAYFLGTGFWVKAFAAASRAGDSWERRQKEWLKSGAFLIMALAPLCTLAAAFTGGATDSGRLAPIWHAVAAGLALLAALVSLLAVPREMLRNAALMDELAARHQVPRPGTPAAAELRADADAHALPPLFQLSRVLLFLSAQAIVVWLYLRFGTESWRQAPFLPFGIGAVLLLAAGLGLNAAHDPEHPRPAPQAWARALIAGLAGAAVLALLVSILG
jgi:hypothetical protein